ncbi:FixH family protein [Marinobacter confluentis]|uniref:Nitrogen fixation protein FixH n=1 Tax=Marinobacter confluentis TaxID=1697557 RepID=A0A4Z1BF93_9GAMM|nr:FixH family protein [Marinobacter confluentis]TGN41404.1 nitrogen fixation protein FixH [Marinobacter confluentis]
MSNEEIVSPWYKQPWFWFLLIFPGAAIIWCISMITVALNIDSSMVTDDYSKQGRGIAMERARDETARAMGLTASLDFDERTASLTMDAATGNADFPYVVLNLFHPTLTEFDRTIQFRPSGEGQYTANLSQPIDGRWYFDLRGPDNDWRLKGEANLPMSRNLILGDRTDDRG